MIAYRNIDLQKKLIVPEMIMTAENIQYFLLLFQTP